MIDSKIKKISVSSLLIIGLFLILLMIFIDAASYSYLSPAKRIALSAAVCLAVYGAALIAASGKRNPKKIILPALLFVFIIYLDLILFFTIFDPSFGRGNMSLYSIFKSYTPARKYYNMLYINFTPFKSIYGVYIRGFSRDLLGAMTTAVNLIGNLCIFMPLAFFCPIFSEKLKKWYFFVPIPIIFSCLIEGTQYLLMCGSCDVDDVILNAGGAIIFFLIMKIPFISRIASVVTLGAYGKNK